MDTLKAILKRFTGTTNPFTSMTFWAALILSGLPAALAQTAGIDLDQNALGQLLAPNLSPGARFSAVLALFGIRRRL